MSGQAVYTLQLTMRNSVVACSCTELSLLSVEMEKKICGFLKNVGKNVWTKKRGKKRCFFYWCSYTLCIQTIMNTNKVTVSARLLFIRHDARQASLVYIHTPEMSEHRRVSNLGLYISFGKRQVKDCYSGLIYNIEILH